MRRGLPPTAVTNTESGKLILGCAVFGATGDTSMLIIDGPAEEAREVHCFAGAVRRFAAAAAAGCRVSLDRALRIFGGVREPDVEDPSAIAAVT